MSSPAKVSYLVLRMTWSHIYYFLVFPCSWLDCSSLWLIYMTGSWLNDKWSIKIAVILLADILFQHFCSFTLSYRFDINTLRPRQIVWSISRRHFLKMFEFWIKISWKFVPKSPINYIPALVQIMAWRHPGDKPLSEPMIVSLPMHICF